jgi:methyltransferase NSUN6
MTTDHTSTSSTASTDGSSIALDWNPDVKSYLAAALGSERFKKVSEALCRPPLSVCLRVNTLRTTPEVCLP